MTSTITIDRALRLATAALGAEPRESGCDCGPECTCVDCSCGCGSDQ
ncbi:MAG: hypothetical protein Q7T55_22420 [Solirubrobacteraceae bacterium]|nr:hypothetical protein [Solirubrobacteraceae bacterium]